MSLLIKEITDKAVWENFLLKQTPNSFLQSWTWGDLQLKLGQTIFRLGIFDNEKLVGLALIIKITARRGTFLHCAYGPLLDWNRPELFNIFITHLKNLALNQKAVFIRVNPLAEKSDKLESIFTKAGFRPAPVHLMNPETSWMLDITPTEEDILKNMRKTTRYLIRKAAKDGVTIKQSQSENDLKIFYDIHLDTVKRQHFIPYRYDFLKTQLDLFKPNDQIKIFLAEYEGKPIAASIIMFHGDEASYHHAATLSEFNKIPASYLIQWEVIKEAKKRGLKTYNFWGIVEDNPKHPWAGLSLFKMGFGGHKKDYLHVQDLPLNKKYWLNWLVEKLRRWKRGY